MYKFILNQIKRTKAQLSNEKGDAYVSDAVRIVISIVLGGALIAGFILIVNSTILPGLGKTIDGSFSKGQVEELSDIGRQYQEWKREVQAFVNKEGISKEEFDESLYSEEVDELIKENPDLEPIIEDLRTTRIDISSAEGYIFLSYNAYNLKTDDITSWTSDGYTTVQEFNKLVSTNEGMLEVMDKTEKGMNGEW